MMFSKSNNSFYDPEFKDSYIKSNNWPTDLIEVSIDLFESFGKASAPIGKRLGHNSNGLPAWVDEDIPSVEEMTIFEKEWRLSELENSDKYMTIDFPFKREEDKAEILLYRKELRDYTEVEGFPFCKRPETPTCIMLKS